MHKDSEISAIFKWMPPPLYVASKVPAHMRNNPKICSNRFVAMPFHFRSKQKIATPTQILVTFASISSALLTCPSRSITKVWSVLLSLWGVTLQIRMSLLSWRKTAADESLKRLPLLTSLWIRTVLQVIIEIGLQILTVLTQGYKPIAKTSCCEVVKFL